MPKLISLSNATNDQLQAACKQAGFDESRRSSWRELVYDEKLTASQRLLAIDALNFCGYYSLDISKPDCVLLNNEKV